MNVGEYGNIIRVDANENISANTNILTLTSPSPVVRKLIITEADGLSIGTSTVVIDNITYSANEYVEYVFKEGDIFIQGEWEARLFSQTSNGEICKITNDDLSFTIDP